jgi:predicted  nucleic acid-binding Zn-ribbon protein
VTLQKAIAELEESYTHLHGQLRSKEVVTSQKYEEMEAFNDQLMAKLRSMTKKYQEREEEFADKYKDLANRFEEFKMEAKKEKEQHLVEEGMLSSTLLQREEELRLLKTENECLKERINELEAYMNELTYDF